MKIFKHLKDEVNCIDKRDGFLYLAFAIAVFMTYLLVVSSINTMVQQDGEV